MPPMTAIEDDRFYSAPEVAALMQVDYRAVLSEIHTGRLHAIAVGAMPRYRIPGWALRDYQAGREAGYSATVAAASAPREGARR